MHVKRKGCVYVQERKREGGGEGRKERREGVCVCVCVCVCEKKGMMERDLYIYPTSQDATYLQYHLLLM